MAATNRLSRPPWGARLATRPLVVVLLLAGVAGLSYANTFHASFHLDDTYSIVENSQIRHLVAFRDLSGTRYVGLLTFALNYAVGGVNPVGYHAVNLLIHLTNGVLVYLLVGLLFRTPALSAGQDPALAPQAHGIALATALLFVVHPVQTQAVTYIVQRFTSLAALFYLLAVVGYLQWRLADPATRGRYGWYAGAVAATILAMKTKEHTFTLPLMLLLIEGVGFGLRPWRKWWPLLPFVALLPLIPLSLSPGLGTEGGDLGMARETTEISRLSYFATQCRVLVTYLRLMVWPVGQNVDYDYPIAHSLLDLPVLASGLFLAGLLGLALYVLRAQPRYRLVGLGVLWFFLTVSVESSIIPIRDVIFEHRMYLPSVGVLLAGSVLGASLLAGWRVVPVTALVVLVALLAWATYERNKVWADELTLWRDAVAKSPQKARGHNNLGRAYLLQGQRDDAMRELATALHLKPDLPEVHMNLGVAYAQQGQVEAAIQEYQTFLRFRPNYAEAHVNLGIAYADQGHVEAAIQEYQTALQLRPNYAEARVNLGVAYVQRGQVDAAIQEYQTALRLRPDHAEVHYNLANAYLLQGRRDDAIQEYRKAIELKPDYPDAHVNLGNAYVQQGQAETAIQSYRRAIELKADLPEPHNNLGSTYLRLGRLEEASIEFQTALQLKPDYRDAHYNLGIARSQQGRWDDATVHYQRALQLRPDWVEVRFQLGQVYLRQGLVAEARRELEAVMRLRPDFAPAQQALDQLDGRR